MGYTFLRPLDAGEAMSKRTRPFSKPAGVVSALCAVWIAGGFPVTPAHSQQGAAPQAVPVGTVPAEKKPISRATDFVGRIEAINRVQIKARVTGYLEAILFKEGDTIAENAPVYRLEKGQFEASVKQAEGALERSKAAKVLTVVQLQRAEDLLKRSAGTEVARDQALASDQQASGAILEAEANLQTAKINLGYTDITSPIVGKIGRTSVTKGNVVGPDTGTLTTIVSQDPMYVTFPVSQRDFLRAQQTGARPDLQALKVKLRYSDGTEYAETGTLNFVDVSVDRSTDTSRSARRCPTRKAG
jgi:membrane fusion protein, multidrug efflux system